MHINERTIVDHYISRLYLILINKILALPVNKLYSTRFYISSLSIVVEPTSYITSLAADYPIKAFQQFTRDYFHQITLKPSSTSGQEGFLLIKTPSFPLYSGSWSILSITL